MKTCPDAYHCPVEATIDIVGTILEYTTEKESKCLPPKARRKGALP